MPTSCNTVFRSTESGCCRSQFTHAGAYRDDGGRGQPRCGVGADPDPGDHDRDHAQLPLAEETEAFGVPSFHRGLSPRAGDGGCGRDGICLPCSGLRRAAGTARTGSGATARGYPMVGALAGKAEPSPAGPVITLPISRAGRRVLRPSV